MHVVSTQHHMRLGRCRILHVLRLVVNDYFGGKETADNDQLIVPDISGIGAGRMGALNLAKPLGEANAFLDK